MGEVRRRNLFEASIDKAREDIIKKHKLCNGTGFVSKFVEDKRLRISKQVVKACSCREKFNLISKFLISNVPYKSLKNQQIYGKIVLDVVADTKIELRSEIINPYVRQIKKALKKPYGFLFLGKNGTGKTFVGLKILYYAIVSGFTAHNIELSEFLRLSRKEFDGGEDLSSLVGEISSVDMLMIDEIGNESKLSNYVISEFKSLLKRRIDLNRPTILISNYSYDEFSTAYGVSIHNLIQAYFKVYDFSTTADVRKTKCGTEMEEFFKGLSSSKPNVSKSKRRKVRKNEIKENE